MLTFQIFAPRGRVWRVAPHDFSAAHDYLLPSHVYLLPPTDSLVATSWRFLLSKRFAINSTAAKIANHGGILGDVAVEVKPVALRES